MKQGHYNVLLIEDSGPDAYTVQRILKKHMHPPCHLRHAENMAEAEVILKNHQDIDLILLDLHLPDTESEKETLERLEGKRNGIPVLILTAMKDYTLAMNSVKTMGADLIDKSLINAQPDIICDLVGITIEDFRSRKNGDFTEKAG